jgi:hypothetical protein
VLAGKSYDLCAVTMHTSEAYDRGHYVSYIRRGDVWHLADDAVVRGPMSWDEVGRDQRVWTDAYVLMYVERATARGEQAGRHGLCCCPRPPPLQPPLLPAAADGAGDTPATQLVAAAGTRPPAR